MDTMTITIESDSGTRMKFQVDHEPHFDLRSETVDGLHSSVRALESTLAEPDDGRSCGSKEGRLAAGRVQFLANLLIPGFASP